MRSEQVNLVNSKRCKIIKKNKMNDNKNKFSMYINNIPGVSSKLNSLESIVENLVPVPSVICLSELNLKKNKKLKIKGYKCYNKNRQERNMGGVATCVTEADESETLKICEGVNEN